MGVPVCWFYQIQSSLIVRLINEWGSPGVSVVKNLPTNAGDSGEASSIPGLGRSPGGGNGNPLQYSCLENPRDRGAWWATVHGVRKSQKWLSMHAESEQVRFWVGLLGTTLLRRHLVAGFWDNKYL